jgi:putative transcriptional regulator
MILHHPSHALLCEYAAGCLSEATALAIATHASMCSGCAGNVLAFEAVGGALIDAAPAADVRPDALEGVFAALEQGAGEAAMEEAGTRPLCDAETCATVPIPLRGYLTGSLGALPWRRVGNLFDEVRLPMASPAVKASLMRIKAGTALPRHSHRGMELTVVLAGGFSDLDGHYGRGDLAEGDPTDEHRPVVDHDADCLCLVVLDAPVRLLGVVGRLINPFLRI